MAQTILIVDDESDLRDIYSLYLDAEECQIFEAGSAKQSKNIIEKELPDLVLLDLGLPDEGGITVLKWLRDKYPLIETIIISGTGSIEKALESVRLGAFDYLEKPVDSNRLIVTVRNALSRASLSKEKADFIADLNLHSQMIGNSKAMQEIFELIEIAGPTEASVLIQGESGVGKELVAKAIQQRSKRNKKPYVKLNCAAIPQELIESELFGHVKGSFTGATESKDGKVERADGGTLFLDEIGDMSLLTQAKVLRFLQEGEIERVGGSSKKKVDVRIIAATNKDLEEEINQKNFRSDLFYRLNVISIHVPPLRARLNDLPILVTHFLEKHGRKKGYSITGIEKAVLDMFQSYYWPGNVRELENLIERSVIFCKGSLITLAELPSLLNKKKQVSSLSSSTSFSEQVDYHMRDIIVKTLEENHWNQSKAASDLGLHRNTLISKMKKLNISQNTT